MIQQQLFTYFRKISSDKRKSGKNFLFLEQLTNTYPYPVICLDRKGNVIFCNRAANGLYQQALTAGKEINEAIRMPLKFDEIILNDREINYSLEIGEEHFPVIIKGSSHLRTAFVYFQDTRLEQENHKLKTFSNKMQETFEEEKQKLACELHDTVGQNLLSLRVKLQKHRDLFSFYNSMSEYQDLLNLLEYSCKHIKLISYSLKPRILDEMGLGPALISFCHSISDETGTKGSIDIVNSQDTPDIKNPPDNKLEGHLYRITQQTLYNRLCSSDLTEFNIQLIQSPLSVKIFFTDNGTSTPFKRSGLKEFTTYNVPLNLIKEKVESMEGTMKIDSSPVNGTIIIVEIPKKAS